MFPKSTSNFCKEDWRQARNLPLISENKFLKVLPNSLNIFLKPTRVKVLSITACISAGNSAGIPSISCVQVRASAFRLNIRNKQKPYYGGGISPGFIKQWKGSPFSNALKENAFTPISTGYGSPVSLTQAHSKEIANMTSVSTS